MQNEIWKDVPGFPGYQVSNTGLIRLVDDIELTNRLLDRAFACMDDNDPRNKYSIWNCLCLPYGHKREPRRRYQITAASAPQAAQMAMTNYRNDINGKEG